MRAFFSSSSLSFSDVLLSFPFLRGFFQLLTDAKVILSSSEREGQGLSSLLFGG
jgi:hypothetical protein